MTLYLWLILTLPTDRTVCALWVSAAPTVKEMRQACPWPLPTGYLWRGVDLASGEVICERPASELPLLNCDIFPLKNYRIVVIEPDYQVEVCTVLNGEQQPTDAEISSACPAGTLNRLTAGDVLLKLVGAIPDEPEPFTACPMPPVMTGTGLLETPADPSGLVTREPLALLAGRLLWFGIAVPNCNSWSGIDPETGAATACGLASALPELLAWQNRFDDVIWSAAVQSSIPAVLLKRMILVESQFWPLWKPPYGERGLVQLTESGADTVLQYSARLFDYYCPIAINPPRCTGWGNLTKGERTAITIVLMNDMSCPFCSPEMAARHARETMPVNAEILRAYYCHAAEVTGTPSWDSALVDFNAGQDCLVNGCQAGKDYLRTIK